jgi:hypothetical protein
MRVFTLRTDNGADEALIIFPDREWNVPAIRDKLVEMGIHSEERGYADIRAEEFQL